TTCSEWQREKGETQVSAHGEPVVAGRRFPGVVEKGRKNWTRNPSSWQYEVRNRASSYRGEPMASGQLHDVLHFLRQSARSADVENLSDGDLLDGFVSRGDASAFSALLLRHGGLVLGVCRRLLPPADADDAFQATFLIFLRKARSLNCRHLVGNWLYG